MMERLVSRLFRWLTTSTEYEQYCSMVGADGDIAAQATANCKSCTAMAPAMANKKSACDESSKVGLCGKEASWP